MLTRKRFAAPVLTNNWTTDGPNLLRAINEYLLSLESPQALELSQVISVGFASSGTILGMVADAAAADQSLTSNTTLTDATSLGFAIAANQEWCAEFVLDVGAALATTGIKVAVNAPTGATLNVIASLSPNVFGAANDGNKRSTTIAGAMDFTAAGQVGVGNAGIRVGLWVLNGSTAGTMQLQFAQSTSSLTALTIRKGSFFKASRIA